MSATPAPAPASRPARPPLLPPVQQLLDPTEPFALPLLALLVTRAFFWFRLPFASEDAYITFRYARNFAEGLGLVYNEGQRVMGYSSPLWALWNALGYLLMRDPVMWSRATSLGADVLALLLMTGLLRRHASKLAAWCFAFFFAVWPYFGATSASGMESATMFSLVCLAAALVERGSVGAGPALAALALIRPEGIAAAAVLAVGARMRDRLAALGLLLAALAATLLYYGTAVPQSVLAKSELYGTPGPWAGRFWWEWLSPVALGRWPSVAEGSQLFFLCVVFAPAAVVGARELWARRDTALARAVAAGLVVWLGYVAVGTAYFSWYFLVPLAALAALAASGVPQLVKGPAVPIACALYVAGTWSMTPMFYIGRAQHEYLGFQQVADYLRDNARPGDEVMLEPIGMVGYEAPVEVVDEVGLVTPGVARRRTQGAGWYADVARGASPDWLVVRRGELENASGYVGKGDPFRSPAERDSVLAPYRLVQEIGSNSSPQELLVFHRARPARHAGRGTPHAQPVR